MESRSLYIVSGLIIAILAGMVIGRLRLERYVGFCVEDAIYWNDRRRETILV